MRSPAALTILWRFDNGTIDVQDFALDGTMSVLAKEIATHMEVVDSGVAFWRNVAGDHVKTILQNRERIAMLGDMIEGLRERIAEQDRLQDFVLERLSVPLSEAMK